MKVAFFVATILAVAFAQDSSDPPNEALQAVIDGGKYTFEEVLDGTFNLEGKTINGVDGVVQTKDSRLVGAPSKVTELLRSRYAVIFPGRKYLTFK